MLDLLAQATPPATQPEVGGLQAFFTSPLFPLLIGLVLIMFISSRSKRKQEKERQDLINNLKKNDRVQTIGGILGSVISTEGNEVIVKVDETNNTKMRFVRSAILRVVTEDTKTETK